VGDEHRRAASPPRRVRGGALMGGVSMATAASQTRETRQRTGVGHPALATQVAGLFPETRRRYAQCLKKLGYPSPVAAEAVRQRQQTRTDEVLRVYACDDCGLWHLTHKPMTAVQIMAEEAWLEAELTQLHEILAAGRTLLKPYLRHHAMWRKSIAALDDDFARIWGVMQRMQDVWMGVFQRDLALERATAANRHEVDRIEREAMAILAQQERLFTRDWERHQVIHRFYREGIQSSMNAAYRLPRFEWRPSGGSR
jgi:hypothetical protein